MACEKHPLYSGLRLGRNARECPDCHTFYLARKARGDKEVRDGTGNRTKPVAPVAIPAVSMAIPTIPENVGFNDQLRNILRKHGKAYLCYPKECFTK